MDAADDLPVRCVGAALFFQRTGGAVGLPIANCAAVNAPAVQSTRYLNPTALHLRTRGSEATTYHRSQKWETHMNEQLESYLCSRNPKLLPTEGEGCLPLFGFECMDGWFPLIYAACELIQAHSNHPGSEQVVASQVKEKFGGLRFYYHGGDDYVEAVVDLVERLSEFICELCGTPGHISERNGWLNARCEVHEKQSAMPTPELNEWIRQGDSMARVLGSALKLFVFNAAETSRWLTSPAMAAGTKSPLELLRLHNGFRDVSGLIGRIEHGVSP